MNLMDKALRQKFEDLHLVKGRDKFTRRMVITIADELFLNPKEVVTKLIVMGCIPTGSWACFEANGGITDEHIRQVREEMYQ